jgi:hypothetical protein
MNRWVKIGGAVLLLAWTPFLYAELTSDPHEKKDRVIPDQEDPDPAVIPAAEATGEAEAEEPEGAEDKAEAVKAAPSPEPQKAPDEGIEPETAEALAEPDNEPTGAAHQEAPAPKPQGPVAALKGAFDSEPRDALWAKDAEAKIAAVYAGEDIPESLFDKSACQKTVCRVELTWSQENAAPFLDTVDELHKAFATDFAVDPQAPADKEGEDALAVHVYVMRKGYTVGDVAK